MMLVSDTTVRTVVYALDAGDSPNLPWEFHSSDFRPAAVHVEITDGAVTGVKVDGPAVTKSGKAHVWNVGDWSWGAGRYRPPWPPVDAPDIAVRVVADLLATEVPPVDHPS